MLFCFFGEGCPVGFIVIGVCVSVSYWGVACFGGDDDWKVVRAEGSNHFP